mgnify:CR=1 FL=1
MAKPNNPKPYKSEKLWRDALMLAIHRMDDSDGDKKKYLAKIAEKTVMKAAEGDMMAIREIGDRLDGKPTQQTEITGKDGGPIETRGLPATASWLEGMFGSGSSITSEKPRPN